MTSLLERSWYQKSLLTIFLFPLSIFFSLLIKIRYLVYKSKILPSMSAKCPIVIIGNISVGGVGKTPLVLALLQSFQSLGIRAGVISRGYKGSAQGELYVESEHDAKLVGDEPILLAQSGFPVVIGRDRHLAAELLLMHHPDIQLILSDDGLQHYRLNRSLEIAVIDGIRAFGNGYLLPAGPLREPVSRLQCVQALVINGVMDSVDQKFLPEHIPVFQMQLLGNRFYHLSDDQNEVDADFFYGKTIAALSAIGNPDRFFSTLKTLGISNFQEYIFPDHHYFQYSDIPNNVDIIIVTSKDAVKLKQCLQNNIWVLPVQAHVNPDLATWILKRLGISYG